MGGVASQPGSGVTRHSWERGPLGCAPLRMQGGGGKGQLGPVSEKQAARLTAR